MYVCMYVYMYVYTCVCMFVCLIYLLNLDITKKPFTIVFLVIFHNQILSSDSLVSILKYQYEYVHYTNMCM